MDDLYTHLNNSIRDMLDLADGQHHENFLEKKKELVMIREIIEEKKQFEVNEILKPGLPDI